MSATTRDQKKSAPLVSTQHEFFLDSETVRPFADWLDEKLGALEEKYDADCTKQSLKKFLIGSR